MSKKTFNNKQTSVHAGGGVGMQTEATVTVEDNILPAASELQAYSQVNPDIVPTLLKMAEKEQAHRHEQNNAKVAIVQKSEERNHIQTIVGMLLATLIVLAQLAIVVIALIYDKPWIVGLFSATSFATISSIFIRHNKGKE